MIIAALTLSAATTTLVENDIGSIGKMLLILDKVILDSDDTKV